MDYLADLAVAESKHAGAAAAAVAAAKSKAISSAGSVAQTMVNVTTPGLSAHPRQIQHHNTPLSGFDQLSAALEIATSPRPVASSGPIVAPGKTWGLSGSNPVAPSHHQGGSETRSSDSTLPSTESALAPVPPAQATPPSEAVPSHRKGRYMLRFKLQGLPVAARLTEKVCVGRLLTPAEKFQQQKVNLPRNIAYEVTSMSGGLVACPCCMRAAKQAERQGEDIYSKHGGRVEHLKEMIRSGHQEPVQIAQHPEKGRILLTETAIDEGQFVMEYVGQLIDEKEALRREKLYAGAHCGSYMFFFEHNGKTHCIDATAELPSYGNGRLLSHSRANPNLKPEKVVIGGVPRLCLTAKHFIPAGTELQYDYGDRDPETMKHFTWLAHS